MPAAHGYAVRRDELAEELDAFGLAHIRDDRGQPFVVVAFDGELPLPPRCQQIGPRLWQLVPFDLVGVVGLDEDVLQGRGPFAMGRHGEWQQVCMVRRADFLQQVRAAQDLCLR